ncbi:perforin-1-like [Hoplias malabaricus]|uniref:perforin-1-like n=1 Tax=Hoplias malabaricus TaxID=27720 RepID=UPI00346315F7
MQMMGQMWHCLVSSWICCALLFLVSGEEQLELGSPTDCEKADFVPGHNLGGEGFDVVKMERKGAYVINMEKWDIGNGSCKMFNNLYLNNVKQKVPAAVVFWRTLPKCSMKVSSKIYESVEAVMNECTSPITNDWKTGLDVSIQGPGLVGGTQSREARFCMEKSKEDKFSFTKHAIQCSFYTYQITNSPSLHQEFLQAVQSLPAEPNSEAYEEIIHRFGTHYITNVELGGKMKALTAIRTCQAAMNGLRDTDVQNCLEVEASGMYNSATLNTESKHCRGLQSKMKTNEKYSSMFSERQTEIVGGSINGEDLLFSSTSHKTALNNWLKSLKTIPDVVTYKLYPLHSVLKTTHHARVGLKKAVEKYILKNALENVCSGSCKIGHKNSSRDRCACICEANENIMSNCCPPEKGLASLRVYNLYAKGLYGDTWGTTDGVVQVKYGNTVRRTAEITDDNPRWRESFDFGPVRLSMSERLTFEVYDADRYWNSDLLGKCSFSLRSGVVSDECVFTHGTFFFSYSVNCAPSLQGPKCGDYKSSPMAAPLAQIFQSRNGILAKDLWKLQNYTNALHFKRYN